MQFRASVIKSHFEKRARGEEGYEEKGAPVRSSGIFDFCQKSPLNPPWVLAFLLLPSRALREIERGRRGLQGKKKKKDTGRKRKIGSKSIKFRLGKEVMSEGERNNLYFIFVLNASSNMHRTLPTGKNIYDMKAQLSLP